MLQRLVQIVRQPLWAIDRIGQRLLPEEGYARLRFGSARDCSERLQRAIEPDHSPVFVFPPPSVAWGYLFQRPQQMALALARLGLKVLYAADRNFSGLPDRRVRGALRLPEGPTLFADGRGGSSVAALASPLVCWQYWPHQSSFRQLLPAGHVLIYDCLDALSVFESYPGLVEDHRQTLAEADLVLATSSRLQEEIGKVRPDVLLVPNAVAYKDFAAPERVQNSALMRLRGRSVIGYFGALAPWVDWGLLMALARTRRDWTLLLVGDRTDHGSAVDCLSREPNVMLWPPTPYRHLGQVLSAFDVAILPFQVDELTKAVSPIKVFEYMAGGKPAVSTPLPEVLKYPEIRVASSVAGFIREIEWSLGPGQSEEHRRALQARAREHTWRTRALAVLGRLISMGLIDGGWHERS